MIKGSGQVMAKSLSCHTDNTKDKVLVLGKGLISGLNGSFGSPEKKISIDFSKARKKFCLILNYNGDNNYLLVNGKEIYVFKANN